jgi:hypothetical protein
MSPNPARQAKMWDEGQKFEFDHTTQRQSKSQGPEEGGVLSFHELYI